jgi:hypothetical protein
MSRSRKILIVTLTLLLSAVVAHDKMNGELLK